MQITDCNVNYVSLSGVFKPNTKPLNPLQCSFWQRGCKQKVQRFLVFMGNPQSLKTPLEYL